MKKKYKIVSIFMALLMFSASTGFSMDMHYCKGQLKNVSFLGAAKSCHDIILKNTCHQMKMACHDQSAVPKKKKCCDNHEVVMDLDEDFIQIKTIKLSKDDLTWSVAIIPNQNDIVFNSQFCFYSDYENYKPPLLNKDIPVFVQSFLI